MKPDIASAVLSDLAKKRGASPKNGAAKSRGARLIEAVKNGDADAVESILGEGTDD